MRSARNRPGKGLEARVTHGAPKLGLTEESARCWAPRWRPPMEPQEGEPKGLSALRQQLVPRQDGPEQAKPETKQEQVAPRLS